MTVTLDRAVPSLFVTTRTKPAGARRPREGSRAWRPDIQGMRAVAVLLVVLYHSHVPGVTGGYVGVDVFFVISGFLITGHLLSEAVRSGRVRFLPFYASRARRLLPMSVLVVSLTVLLSRVWSSIFEVKALTTDAIFTAFYGLNWRLASQGIDYQEGGGRVSPLQHFWSLAVEEQFYVLWPAVIALCFALGGRHRLKLLAAALLALTGTSLWQAVVVTSHNAPLGYYGLHTRVWELGVGALMAMAIRSLARVPSSVAAIASWLGVAAIVISALVYDDKTLFPGVSAVLPVGGAALVIAAGCVDSPRNWSVEWLLKGRIAQGIGQVSYGWYLWHWPMLILVPLAFGFEFSWVLNLEVAALSLWFAVLSYYVIESQTQRTALTRPRRWLGVGFGLSTTSVMAALAVALTVPGLVGSGEAAVPIVLSSSYDQAIVGVVEKALAVTHVPSNLTPALERADKDLPPSSADNCHLDFLESVQPSGCAYGDTTAAKTVVLFGDSHAQQWLPGLDAAGKADHWRVLSWTKAACPIATVVITNDTLHRRFTECETWRSAMLAKISALHPALVVLGQADGVPGRQISNSRWSETTITTAKEIQAAGVPVTYLLDTPRPPGLVPACLAQHLADTSTCALRVSEAYPFDDRRAELARALSIAGVRSLDVQPWLCSDTLCPAVVGNMLVYRDASHLSATYSRWLAPLLSEVLSGSQG